jgi:hypothetical protein
VQQNVAHHSPESSGNAEKPRRSVHDICILVKGNSVEIASTAVFLVVLFKGVWWELGLPAIPWEQIVPFK